MGSNAIFTWGFGIIRLEGVKSPQAATFTQVPFGGERAVQGNQHIPAVTLTSWLDSNITRAVQPLHAGWVSVRYDSGLNAPSFTFGKPPT